MQYTESNGTYNSYTNKLKIKEFAFMYSRKKKEILLSQQDTGC